MYATCRSCKGTGSFYPHAGKRLDCRACDGTGLNKKFYVTTCSNGYCSTEITYPVGNTAPKYCKNCSNQEREKTCAQDGCYNTIKFKLGWSNVSDYCKNCYGKRQNGWSPRRCNGPMLGANCGKLIWVPPGKNFTMCQECNARAQEKKAAQWKTTSCKNCRAEIKYHVDWNRVPNLCASCKEKGAAKWKEKPCAGGCGTKISYRVDSEHPKNFCDACKAKRQSDREKNSWPVNKPLPGSNRSVADIGCTHATVTGPNKYGGKHVTVYNREIGYHEHYSYDTNDKGEYVAGTAHITDAMAIVLRKHGHVRT